VVRGKCDLGWHSGVSWKQERKEVWINRPRIVRTTELSCLGRSLGRIGIPSQLVLFSKRGVDTLGGAGVLPFKIDIEYIFEAEVRKIWMITRS
jgi:hypothetical protein